MAEVPKASVFVLTHDHVDWIAQALDSALAQQAPFEFELLVADDRAPTVFASINRPDGPALLEEALVRYRDLGR